MSQNQPAQPERIDELLTLLANQHCRATLSYFQGAPDDVASVQELVNEIHKEDHGGTKQFTLRLHHSILPRLADTEAIDYDARTQTIRYHGHSELEQLLDSISERFPKADH